MPFRGFFDGFSIILGSPEITYKVWKHYPEKELIKNNGMHQNVNMIPGNDPLKFVTEVDNMAGNSENTLYYPFGDIFRLKKPSSLETKTKSVIFDPNIIDNNGKMNIDWNNSNIGNKTYNCQVTKTEEDRRQGLMGIEHLP